MREVYYHLIHLSNGLQTLGVDGQICNSARIGCIVCTHMKEFKPIYVIPDYANKYGTDILK